MPHSVFVIAEAGVNHNGSVERAQAMVRAAKEAGADAIKFQTFQADALVGQSAEKAPYQKLASGAAESQHQMLKQLELDAGAHHKLARMCADEGIEFMSTAFDLDSFRFLVEEVGLRRIKIPSGEIVNPLLLLAAARTDLPILLSTGMATLGEIEDALSVLAYGLEPGEEPPGVRAFGRAYAEPDRRARLAGRVTLLHCTSAYPTPAEEVNLLAMDSLAHAFGLRTGLSDHSQGTAVAVAAAARGAASIEKHFTLDRGLPGPDHSASLEPAELADMIAGIRTVERALGSPCKALSPSESQNRVHARKGLYAARAIAKGERIGQEDLLMLRPETGRSPMRIFELIGRAASRDYRAMEPFDE